MTMRNCLDADIHFIRAGPIISFLPIVIPSNTKGSEWGDVAEADDADDDDAKKRLEWSLLRWSDFDNVRSGLCHALSVSYSSRRTRRTHREMDRTGTQRTEMVGQRFAVEDTGQDGTEPILTWTITLLDERRRMTEVMAND